MASFWHDVSLIVLVLLLIGVSNSKANPAAPPHSQLDVNHKKPIQTFRPYNIAHRGSNGELPEETAAAYLRAIEEGADFIETDILASKDGHLICFHDVTLDATTNVANHTEFADRKRTYEVQGENVTGWFIVDFTLKELKSLRVKQRLSFRDQRYNGKYQIITFEEYILIALYADRIVGIYPEIKNPIFINQHVKWSGGKKFEDKFVEMLLKYGYKGEYMSEDWLKQPLFIQSFAPTSLIYISNVTNSPKLFLIDDTTIPTQDTNQSYYEITSNSYLEFIRNYVIGIGPWKDTIVPPNPKDNCLGQPTDLVARAHSLNLQVHPYTFRNENQYLHFDFHQDPYAEYEYWLNEISVDGLFTDFTGSLHKYQEWTTPYQKKEKNPEALLREIANMLKNDGY
ncbi:glycerophosphodiester phosphodiesterase GDPD6-like [Miscanthus floridulus]|uniref:glycerophosphodiester phosphodiesterase GDPD6-like n=1 Tax=Miscanthus floridulus TaxID=154761 RepID=UPI00345972F9